MTRPRLDFPTVGAAGQPPPPRTFAQRLALLALAVVNRVAPKRPGKVVLHSPGDLDDGILAVIQALAARGVRPVVLIEDARHAALVRALTSAEAVFVPKRSLRALVHYVTAGYVLLTHGLFGDFEPPPSQVVVNLWHGEPPTKVAERFEGLRGPRCTVAPVLSTVGRAYRATEFGLHPHRVPIIGAPRNDRMLAADGRAIRDVLVGADVDGTAFLWMPTFRAARFSGRLRVDGDDRHPGVPFSPEAVAELDAWLSERGATVLLKLHPHDVRSFSAASLRAIRVLDPEVMRAERITTYPLLSAFDCLITDASSVWTDFLLLDRPMIFAFPDVEDYRRHRGLNLEPYEAWAPGAFVRTVAELEAAMDAVIGGEDPTREERGRARVRFHQHLDGRSSERLLDGLGIRGAPERPPRP